MDILNQTIVKKDQWDIRPMPDNQAHVVFHKRYSALEFELLCHYRIPIDMERRWFIYFESPYLYVHRSWTGFCAYMVNIEPIGKFHYVQHIILNREPNQIPIVCVKRRILQLFCELDRWVGRDTNWIRKKLAKLRSNQPGEISNNNSLDCSR